jgi:hypothetical protein
MPVKWIRAWGILAVVLLVTPLVVLAQESRRGDRGDIQVTNDWDNTVKVTLWKQRGEQISRRSWTIAPGQSAMLGDDGGRSIRVRADDKIKVGEEWGRVDIGAVGQWQRGTWNVSVRDIWRATRERRSRPGLPPDQSGTALPPDQSPGILPGQRR